MGADLEVQVRRGAWVAYLADLVAAPDAVTRFEDHTGWIEMPIEGKEGGAVVENMADDEHAFIWPPAIAIGVGHLTMTNSVNGFTKVGPRIETPIFPGVIFLVAVTPAAKIAAATGVQSMSTKVS